MQALLEVFAAPLLTITLISPGASALTAYTIMPQLAAAVRGRDRGRPRGADAA